MVATVAPGSSRSATLSAGDHVVHQRVDVAVDLTPDFDTETKITCGSVFIVQLIGPPVVRPPADLSGLGDHRVAATEEKELSIKKLEAIGKSL